LEGEFLFCGRFVKVSTDSWLAEKKLSIPSISGTGSNFSFVGEGIKDMLTGSEDPSNQLASLSTVEAVFFFGACSSGGNRVTSNCAASVIVTLSGDRDRVL